MKNAYCSLKAKCMGLLSSAFPVVRNICTAGAALKVTVFVCQK
jgi:hypothetical protein